MKLSDPELDRQLRAGAQRYDELPEWMRKLAEPRVAVDHERMHRASGGDAGNEANAAATRRRR